MNNGSQGPAREETPTMDETREDTIARLLFESGYIKCAEWPDRAMTFRENVETALEQSFDAGAKSVVAAPQNQIGAIERSSRRIAGNPAICSQTYSREWRIEHIQEVLESELAGAAALPSAQKGISQQGASMKLIADENENGSTAEMVWLQHQITEGRGEVRFGYTNDGDVGVWLGSEVNAAGAGDYAEDAIRIAMMRELPSPPVPSKEKD